MLNNNKLAVIQHRCESVRELWTRKELCDFVIKSGDSEFHVHKLTLAACSQYFRALFQFNSNENRDNELNISDFTSTVIGNIIEYCYTADISLNDDSIQETLLAASYFQMDTLLKSCEEYIELNISTSNCLGITVLADRCNLRDLYEKAFNFSLNRFEDVVGEPEFHDLEESWLIKFIADDRLRIRSEEGVFEAVIDWICADETNRISCLKNLAEHIRFPLIGAFTLIKMKSHRLVKDSLECCKRIEEAKDYLLLRDHPEQEAIISLPVQSFQPRKYYRQSQRILAVGGWNEYRPTDSVEKYDPDTNDKSKWKEVKSMNRRRCGVGLTILDGYPYAIGGHDGQSYLRSVERYDVQKDTWIDDVACMHTERTSLGVVSLDGFVYAIGGQNGNESLSIVERYDPRKNLWQFCKSMRERRLGAGVAVLDGYIYVIGGADKSSVLQTVERYDPKSDSWTYVSSLGTRRKHLGCTAFDGKIYAVGGRDEKFELDTAESYDPATDRWELLPNMSTKRSGLGLVVLDRNIYVIGGQSGGDRLKLVEAYDPETKSWTEKEPMNQERLGCGVVVLAPLNDNYPDVT